MFCLSTRVLGVSPNKLHLYIQMRILPKEKPSFRLTRHHKRYNEDVVTLDKIFWNDCTEQFIERDQKKEGEATILEKWLHVIMK